MQIRRIWAPIATADSARRSSSVLMTSLTDEDMQDGGSPAFPVSADDVRCRRSYAGMSLRDYFAGQALVGLLAFSDGKRRWEWEEFAEAAYALADALLAERRRG